MNKNRIIQKSAVIEAPRSDVWNRWTSKEGILSFFGRDCNLEFKVGGKFEILFMLENEPGLQGSEGCKIMGIEEETMLSFSWNAPPHLSTRGQNTFVVVKFEDFEDGQTQVEINHTGFGESEDWTATYNYFVGAWERVLGNLKNSIQDSKKD